jgi:hypothetical protein
MQTMSERQQERDGDRREHPGRPESSWYSKCLH